MTDPVEEQKQGFRLTDRMQYVIGGLISVAIAIAYLAATTEEGVPAPTSRQEVEAPASDTTAETEQDAPVAEPRLPVDVPPVVVAKETEPDTGAGPGAAREAEPETTAP